MWNCETRGTNSVITFLKITNIWSGWIFILIFLQNQKRFWNHFIVFMLLNWLQRLDYQGDFEINISAIKNSLKKNIFFFFYKCETIFSFMNPVHSFISSFTFLTIFFVVKTRVFGLFFEKNEVSYFFFAACRQLNCFSLPIMAVS